MFRRWLRRRKYQWHLDKIERLDRLSYMSPADIMELQHPHKEALNNLSYAPGEAFGGQYNV